VHWEAIKWIFHYLAGMCNLWLSYSESKCTLEGYANTDGSMAKDRHAIAGYAFLIDSSAVLWSSKQQEIVSLSTTESKYVVKTHGGKEALWLHSLISEVFRTLQEPTTLFSDNQAAITLMHRPNTLMCNTTGSIGSSSKVPSRSSIAPQTTWSPTRSPRLCPQPK
jgi:hypothetical protein